MPTIVYPRAATDSVRIFELPADPEADTTDQFITDHASRGTGRVPGSSIVDYIPRGSEDVEGKVLVMGRSSSDPDPALVPSWDDFNELAQSSSMALAGRDVLRTQPGHVDRQRAYLDYLISEGDGVGGTFIFRAASILPDDGVDVLHPSNILPGDPGRWVRSNNL